MLILFLFFPIFSGVVTAQSEFLYAWCSTFGNYSGVTDSYRTELSDIMYRLKDTNNGFGYHKSTYFKGEVVALCRGDLEPEPCKRCVDDATRRLLQVCPSQFEAVGWYDTCFLSYSGLTTAIDRQLVYRYVSFRYYDNASSYDKWNKTVWDLLTKLQAETVGGGPLRKYASGNSTASGLTIFGIMQCRPDLSAQQCGDCLDDCLHKVKELYKPAPIRRQVKVYTTNCVIRYENYRFFNSTWFPANTSSGELFLLKCVLKDSLFVSRLLTLQCLQEIRLRNLQVKSVFKDSLIVFARLLKCTLVFAGRSRTILVVVIVGAVAIIAGIIAYFLFRRYQKRKRTIRGPEPEQVDERIVTRPEPDQAGCSHDARSNPEIIIEDDGTGEVHSFSLSTIQVATNNFSLENVLGEGGFGSVYKGVLENGQAIAVKRLSRNSSQGVVEFKTEVNLVAKVQHRNLVRLLGYCVQEPERLLVYEYMANNSLDTILFDDEKCKELDWVKRAKIINGIANGLRYLHEESRVKIIHRDLKTSNILLDEDMNSLISDFGTARIVGQKQNYAVTQQTIGTYGYMAPEYAMHGRFSTKSDVFGFGMVLLEIVCGQKNNHFRYKNQPEEFLLTASRLWRANKGEELIDGRLALNIPIGKVIRWIHIALLCVEERPGNRPSMSTVVSMLSDQGSGSLPEPINPPMVPRRDERRTEPTMTMDNVGEVFTSLYQPRYTQTCAKFKKKIYEWNSE
ncbi:putative protein kinase RLK-Pelle-DLSV family [Helianthus annuus]|nr:putative protein kinase RLK-Pelle-DLSV family [Helianthus annuus]KAJ0647746.1 putative protein kinase RLK-Pelle-DLSV family [Helianthus annuus]KAJ0651612.1 putative protein kinase RLK-Pelle-DLSV family [Helianthus annuus]KAJ0843605.1 putative protein kinase RLK-Pelle-DLSV family [Helianthus annuus]